MKTILVCIVAAQLTGCAAYQQFSRSFDRSYSVSYEDEQGRKVGAGVTLHPVGGGK